MAPFPVCFFFFSSRRRHTRSDREWSSDVCSSDLPRALGAFLVLGVAGIWGSTQVSYVAYYYTTAGSAVIIQAAAPVMVALTARFYLGERLQIGRASCRERG